MKKRRLASQHFSSLWDWQSVSVLSRYKRQSEKCGLDATHLRSWYSYWRGDPVSQGCVAVKASDAHDLTLPTPTSSPSLPPGSQHCCYLYSSNTHFACLRAFAQHRLLPLHWLCCTDFPHAPLSWLEGHAYNITSLCALIPKFPQTGLSCPLRICWILSFLDQVPKTILKCLCDISLYFPPAHTISFFSPKLVMVDAICQYCGKNRHDSQHNCGVVIVAQNKRNPWG